jgi:hypothetical protein
MFVTNHAVAGAGIGWRLRKFPIPVIFAAGVVSHFVMDAIPHWGSSSPDQFLPVAVTDGLTMLSCSAAMVSATPVAHRAAVGAGIAGATFPDADKPCLQFFGVNPFPDSVTRFHGWIQHERPEYLGMELVIGLLGVTGTLLWLASRE